jgi:multimeric flavodoxin WrbA
MKIKSKKILIITGSPNKSGNTAALVASFSEGCRKAGVTPEIVDAARLKYKVNGCVACMACQRQAAFHCVIKDEASKVISRVPGADILVIATPVYTFGPTAQVKLLLDRFYSLVKCRGTTPTGPLTKLRMVLIASAGGGPAALDPIRRTFAASAKFLGIKFDHLLIPNAGEEGSVPGDKKALRAAYDFGLRLAR